MEKGDVSNVVVHIIKDHILKVDQLPKDHPMKTSTWVMQTAWHTLSVDCGKCSGCHESGICDDLNTVTAERDELMCMLPVPSVTGMMFYSRQIVPVYYNDLPEQQQMNLIEAFVFQMVYELALTLKAANRELAKAASKVYHLSQSLVNG